MMRLLISILFASISLYASACGSAYHFKIFPVGVLDEKIVTIDIQVFRSDKVVYEADNVYPVMGDIVYGCRTFISEYDQNQNLINSMLLDSIWDQESYLEAVEMQHRYAFYTLMSKKGEIELFKPETISMCAFNKKCQLLSIDNDRIIYETKPYRLEVLERKNKDYFGFLESRFYFEEDDEMHEFSHPLNYLTINSIRKYKASNVDLVVLHLANNTFPNEEAEQYFRENNDKEYIPDIPFNRIEDAVYEEPMLFHGYAFDAFFTLK